MAVELLVVLAPELLLELALELLVQLPVELLAHCHRPPSQIKDQVQGTSVASKARFYESLS